MHRSGLEEEDEEDERLEDTKLGHWSPLINVGLAQRLLKHIFATTLVVLWKCANPTVYSDMALVIGFPAKVLSSRPVSVSPPFCDAVGGSLNT